jgi:Phosphotransferase enzyme family
VAGPPAAETPERRYHRGPYPSGVESLLEPAYLGRVTGRRVRAAAVTRQSRPGCTLAWVEPSYAGPPGPRRLLVKVGGRAGDLDLYAAFGDRLPGPPMLDSGTVDGLPYRVAEVVEAPTLRDLLSRDGLVRAAVSLAQLHHLRLDGLALPHPTPDPTPWLWDRAREAWPAYRAAYDPPAAERFQRLLGSPPVRPGPRVVCHGDAHPGNVLLGRDRTRWIDWEDWRGGPGAEDLAFLLADLDPEPRAAWAAAAFDAYVAVLGRPRAQVREELAAALDQVPKMVPFWHAGDPGHESVTQGLSRQWDAWLGGIDALGID